MLRHELRLFLTALQFFTRVPVPAWVGWSPQQLNASARYFPLVGAGVGLVAGGVYLAARLLWPPSIAVLVSMAASVWFTGAFHEDGFADSCDGLGGAADRTRALAIMKDSRVGNYAVVGLVLLLAGKFQALALVPAQTFLAVSVASHAVSRCAVLWVMARLPYLREDDAQAKSKPVAQGIGAAPLAFAVATALSVALPLLGRLGWPALAACGAAAAVAVQAARFLRRRLGGYVGDTLGATQQLAELVFLLVCVACLA